MYIIHRERNHFFSHILDIAEYIHRPPISHVLKDS